MQKPTVHVVEPAQGSSGEHALRRRALVEGAIDKNNSLGHVPVKTLSRARHRRRTAALPKVGERMGLSDDASSLHYLLSDDAAYLCACAVCTQACIHLHAYAICLSTS
jgi:hypothetical protein